MKEIDLPVDKYIGIDIVKDIIVCNKVTYSNPSREFLELNIIEDELSGADLILCRDCFVHLSFANCQKILKNFRNSGSKYLLTTTFTDRSHNDGLGKVFWRTINLELPTFNFPKPISIINEDCTEYDGNYTDKSLGLWLLKDIHNSP